MSQHQQIGTSNFTLGDLGPDYFAKWQAIYTALERLLTDLDSVAGVDANATVKSFLDIEFAKYVKRDGMTAVLNANNNLINLLSDPVASQDAANKRWVLTEIAARILAGGSPGDIAITALGLGALADGEILANIDGAITGKSLSAMGELANNQTWTAPNKYTAGISIVVEGASAIQTIESYGAKPKIDCKKANGTIALPTDVVITDILMEIASRGMVDGVFPVPTAKFLFVANEDWVTGNTGTDFVLELTSKGTTARQEVLRVSGNGDISTPGVFSSKNAGDNFVYYNAGGSPAITIARSARIERRVFWSTTPIITLDSSSFGDGDLVKLVFNGTSGTSNITTGDTTVIYTRNGVSSTSHTFTGVGNLTLFKSDTWWMVIN